MYSLLFRYFYISKKYNQIANGIFYLMQYCLRTLEPNLALKRFLQYQKKNNVKKQINLLRQVQIWKNEPSERDFFSRDEIKTKTHCENLIEFTEKHKNTHDLYMFFDVLAKYSINNLNNIKKTGLVFDLNEQLSNLKYWNSIIFKFGTGIVSYSNCTKIYGHSGHIDRMNDSFLFLLSVNNILKDLFEGNINPCPYSDGDNGHLHICKSTELVNDNCYKNPFLKSKGFKTEKKCLYGNGTYLLGYTNKIQFDSESH
ncbi:hypothetical protein [Marinicella litoralis]|uniref:Uncharacterized protein n=1 Tax=Marinicella litoralis TaxID=644220 RepID=A0A4R6XL42_9GAMM|nr:hypothetical protein [Marinicella litoralis]TDR18267.1 hypothetical protein C8D91_2182 [Marinicella litoralis]